MLTWKKKLWVSMADAFEYYDLAVFAALVTYINANFFPESFFGAYTEWVFLIVFALRFAFRPLGGYLLGRCADANSRRDAMKLSCLITGSATLVMACLPVFDDIGLLATVLLVLMQIMQAFSFGGENVTTTIYVMENTPKRAKAFTGALMWGMVALSMSVAHLTVWLCEQALSAEQMLAFGWRIPFLFGFVNLLFAYWLRRRLVEVKPRIHSSPRIDRLGALQTFLIAIPTTMLFYINTISIHLVYAKVGPSAMTQTWMPMIINVILYACCLLVGLWIDKNSDCHQVMRRTMLGMIFLAVPVYALQDLPGLWPTLWSYAVIFGVLAIAHACGPDVLTSRLRGHNKAASYGVGANFSVVLFGGTAPLMLNFLQGFDHAYVGLFLSFGGVCYFTAMFIERYKTPQQRKAALA